jgi:hypothetical protein
MMCAGGVLLFERLCRAISVSQPYKEVVGERRCGLNAAMPRCRSARCKTALNGQDPTGAIAIAGFPTCHLDPHQPQAPACAGFGVRVRCSRLAARRLLFDINCSHVVSGLGIGPGPGGPYAGTMRCDAACPTPQPMALAIAALAGCLTGTTPRCPGKPWDTSWSPVWCRQKLIYI